MYLENVPLVASVALAVAKAREGHRTHQQVEPINVDSKATSQVSNIWVVNRESTR